MVNPQGKKIEVPVKSCFRNGLSVLEYFISSHGGRKGLTDTALKTADSGYLTRRLVDVSHEIIVREEDCCAGRKPQGMMVRAIYDTVGKEIEGLKSRILGRFAAEDIIHPETGEVLVGMNQFIDEKEAEAIVAAGITEMPIRSVFGCSSRYGVCAKCYGKNMATTLPVQVGESVGVIAAQSIGEPGTQLTMRTFHTGGIASAEDITQGLPRVEELFEARTPKREAVIAEIEGDVRIDEIKKNRHIVIFNKETGEERKYLITYGSHTKVKEGDHVKAGALLTEGSVNPHKYLDVNGALAVQDYLIAEVQKTYRLQGVDINDRHIEVIVRQMMKKVKVDDQGDTKLLSGMVVEKGDFFAENREIRKRIANGETGLREATYIPMLLGITKASLATESFMSAASFQETTRVLTEAAIKGKSDRLLGLKENVIIGKLIPAGTGMQCYSEADYSSVAPEVHPIDMDNEYDRVMEAAEAAVTE
jgi:DNA-directed RNA polymerase subunit beta'